MQRLIYGIGALIALLIVVGFALPRTNRVAATTEIEAHPATVFALVNDFRRYSEWSPWAKTDPNARFIYSGPNRGEGATMTWDGAILGSGAQTIVESKPFSRVAMIMNTGEASETRTQFDVVPGARAGTTVVTWEFEADYGFNIVGRYFAWLLAGVVARDHENGLRRLKELAENLPAANFADLVIEHIVIEATDIAYLRTTSSPEPAATSDAMGKAYFQVLKFIDTHALTVDGAPLSITRNFSGSQLVFDAAIPVRDLREETPRDNAGVKIGATYAGPVIRVWHTGSYRLLIDAHRKISAYLAALGLERNGPAWESYVSDPGNVAEKDLLTYIYYPVRLD